LENISLAKGSADELSTPEGTLLLLLLTPLHAAF
jgi:hypothetical protein